jgi:hypothetical protein
LDVEQRRNFVLKPPPPGLTEIKPLSYPFKVATGGGYVKKMKNLLEYIILYIVLAANPKTGIHTFSPVQGPPN